MQTDKRLPFEIDATVRMMRQSPIYRTISREAVLLFTEADALHLAALGIANDQPTAEACGIR